MTKGKHGAQAARRRQTEYDAELDRLREEVARQKRRADRNEADAQRLPTVERLLRGERARVGVPEYERDRELAELETKWAKRWDDAMDAFITIAVELFSHIPEDTNYMTTTFIAAMQRLPEDVARAATADVWTRDEFRTFMSPGAVAKISRQNTDAIVAAALGRGYASNPNGGIPAEAMEDPEFRKSIERLTGRQTPKKPAETQWV